MPPQIIRLRAAARLRTSHLEPPGSAPKIISAEEKLYPMPVVPESSLPFGVTPAAAAISSAVVLFLLVLFGYLLSLTNGFTGPADL